MSEPWTVSRMLGWAAPFLSKYGSTSARLDAELLLCNVTGMRRLDLYVDHERPLQPDELARFKDLVKRRARQEPVAYILGRRAFHDIELLVGRGALVPRPETEHLVDRALSWLAGKGAAVEGRVVDVGTGTGAIVLAMAKALRGRGDRRPLGATDRSADALGWAQRNAEALGLTTEVELIRADLLGPWKEPASLAAVVSNPPYIRSARMATLDETVRAFEPREALEGGADGLDVLRRLAAQAVPALRPRGLFAVELGDADQGRQLVQLLQGIGVTDARHDPIGPGPTAIVWGTRDLTT